MSRKGFTLFELLGVLTVISIVLVVLLGSYSSWGTAHALTGAARIVESGLQKGRSLAMTQHAYVGFEYGSVTTNGMQVISGFQLYVCSNENAVVAAILEKHLDGSQLTKLDRADMGIIPAAPYQRLSGYIRLKNQSEKNDVADESALFFRPDGSVWSWDDQHVHDLYVHSRELFNKVALERILRVDLATGLVTVLKEEATP